MSDIRIEQTHGMDFDTARSTAKSWLARAKDELGVNIDYQEGTGKDTAFVKKSGVEATATLDGEKVVFEAKLGFLARPFKDKIASEVEKGLKKHFSQQA